VLKISGFRQRAKASFSAATLNEASMLLESRQVINLTGATLRKILVASAA
jgi:hypothetical protein